MARNLDLGSVILHTVVHHSSPSTYMPNFIEIEERFVDGRTYARTYVRTHVLTDGRIDGWTDGHLRPALLGRLCRRVDLYILKIYLVSFIFKILLRVSYATQESSRTSDAKTR